MLGSAIATSVCREALRRAPRAPATLDHLAIATEQGRLHSRNEEGGPHAIPNRRPRRHHRADPSNVAARTSRTRRR